MTYLMWLPITLLSCVLLSGCSNKTDSTSSTADAKTNTSAAPVQEPKVDPNTIQVRLLDLKYSDANKSSITNAMKSLGLKKVYLPQKDTSPDTFVVAGLGENLSLLLNYQYLRITETMDAPVYDHVQKVEPALLTPFKNTGKWITLAGDKGSLHFFTFKIGDVYIKLEDFRKLDDVKVENIAKTFVPFP